MRSSRRIDDLSRPAARCAWTIILLILAGLLLGQSSPPAGTPAAAGASGGFPGWEGMRVIRLEGNPLHAAAADLDGAGRQSVVIANTRQSRLDIFRWLSPQKRHKTQPLDPENPNQLPMASDFELQSVPLSQLPIDVAAGDLDGDGRRELVVLVSSPNRILLLRPDAKTGSWKQADSWDLLPGDFSSGSSGTSVLLLDDADAKDGAWALVSFDEGIQRVKLKPGARADWLHPRERIGRIGWWLADLDGDGRNDLIEWTREPNQSIRWYRGSASGFLPAEVLYDKAVASAAVRHIPGHKPELLLLDQVETGLVRRFELGQGPDQELGARAVLPLAGASKAPWCGMSLDGRPTIVWRDDKQPRLNVSALGDQGWQAGLDYPCVADVQAMAAPRAQPNMLLLWAKDAADLYVSRWEAGRLTFPVPMSGLELGDRGDAPPAAVPATRPTGDRRIVALAQAGSVTWWAQRVGPDLDLYVWPSDAPHPQRTRFENTGEKVEQAVWLGQSRILFREAYQRDCRLASIVNNKTVFGDTGQAGKASLDQFKLYEVDGQLRAARVTDGVMQWLDADLHPTDQVMLPEGRQLAGYLPLGGGKAWALETEGKYVHRLSPDKAGVARVAESVELPGGSDLVQDPVLGLMLLSNDRVIHLGQGRSYRLTLLQTIDAKIGRPGVTMDKDASIHRINCLDLAGDGRDDVLLHDDQHHLLTALRAGGHGDLGLLASWPVFEDTAYPYGGERGQSLAPEPRLMLSLDLDGDHQQDLVMLCHDRLLIYLARDKETP